MGPARAWIPALLLVVLVVAALRLAGEIRGPREARRPFAGLAPAPACPGSPFDAAAAALTTSVRESVSDEEHGEARISEEEAPPDPPTPIRPGPGQALLRIQAVALETDAPLAGIELALFSGDDEEEDREWLFSTQPDPARGVEGDDVRTGAEGRGEFVVEAGRRYRLRGRGADGRAAEAELELAPLAAGAERALRLNLPTAWTLEWHGRIVEGESERPLVGVEVVACVDEYDGIGVELARGFSQGDGRIRLRVPAWERMSVRCALPGFSPGGADLDRAASSLDAPQTVLLRRPGGLLVRVRLPDGRPAEGLVVEVRAPPWCVREGRLCADLQGSATTDADGRCELGELPSRTDLFVSIRRGERTLEWTSMEERFQLEPGELRELEYELTAGVALTVRVRDREGAPLAGAALALWESGVAFDGPWWERFHLDRWIPAESLPQGQRLALLTTDEQGHAQINGVSPGSYWLATEAEDLPPVVWPFRIAPAETSAAGLELRLDRGLFVEGSVVGPEGRPVGAASLELVRDDGIRVGGNTCTEGDGSFVLGPLLDGTYRLRARGCDEPLFAPSETLVVAAGAEPISLAMTWGGRLRARALGVAGEELGPSLGRLFQRGKCVAWLDDGEIGGLAPGTYDVLLESGAGLVGVQRGLLVRARETLEVSVLVEPGATLVVPLAGALGTHGRLTVEWEGLDIGWFYGRELLVPPGTLTVRFLEWGADFTERPVAERVRTLFAGESWAVAPPG